MKKYSLLSFLRTKMQPIAYTRKQIADMLWITEQWVRYTKKVIRIRVRSSRSKKYVTRYILKSDLITD